MTAALRHDGGEVTITVARDATQRETEARGGALAVAAPVLRGVAKIARQRLER